MLCIHMNKKWQEFNLIIFYLLLYIGLFQSVMIYFLYIFSSLKYAKTVRVYYKWICYGCCYSDMQFLYLVFNKGTKKDAKRQKKKKKRINTISGILSWVNYDYIVKRLMLFLKWLFLSVLSAVRYLRFAVKSVFVLFFSSSESVSVRDSLMEHYLFLWFLFSFFFLVYWYLKCESCSGCTKET